MNLQKGAQVYTYRSWHSQADLATALTENHEAEQSRKIQGLRVSAACPESLSRFARHSLLAASSLRIPWGEPPPFTSLKGLSTMAVGATYFAFGDFPDDCLLLTQDSVHPACPWIRCMIG